MQRTLGGKEFHMETILLEKATFEAGRVTQGRHHKESRCIRVTSGSTTRREKN